jgi:hypothetical protein
MPAGRNSQDRGRAMVARILKDVEGRDTEEIELFRDGRDPHLTAGSQIPDTESSPQRRNVGGVVPEVIGIADAQLPRWRGPGRGRNTKAGASKRQGAEGQKPPAAQPATRWLALCRWNGVGLGQRSRSNARVAGGFGGGDNVARLVSHGHKPSASRTRGATSRERSDGCRPRTAIARHAAHCIGRSNKRVVPRRSRSAIGPSPACARSDCGSVPFAPDRSRRTRRIPHASP